MPMYRTRFPGHKIALSGGPYDGLAPRCSCFARTTQAVLLDEPLGVVAGDEVADGVTDLVDGPIDSAVHDLLFEGAEETLDDAIGLGLADERIAGGHAPEADLVVEVFGEERAAVIVAQRHAASGAGADLAEHVPDRHTDGLDGSVAIAALGDMPAERFGVPVLGDAEQPDFAILNGDDLGRIRPPHQVRRRGDDVAIVRRVVARTGAMRRQQGVFAHQPKHSFARHPDAVHHPQPGPNLAMSLTVPGRTGKIGADRRQQGIVRHRRFRSTPRRNWRHLRVGPASVGIEGRSLYAPDAADLGDAVAAAGGRGNRHRHYRDLPRPKGPGRSIRDRSSSFSMLSSPIRCIAVASSPLTTSASRSFNAPSSAASAFRRQRSSL